MPAKPKFYVVWRGAETGVFKTWKECEARIKGFPGALYKSFPDEASAIEAFNQPSFLHMQKGRKKASAPVHGHQPVAKPVVPSLCVDAACSGNPGPMEYQGVDTETGEIVFRTGPFPEGTNNIGEFLAIVHALALLAKKGSILPVYTDSNNAISWLKKRKAATKLPPSEKNRNLMQLVERAEKWLNTNEWRNPVLKWDTKQWGEIPADFGRK